MPWCRRRTRIGGRAQRGVRPLAVAAVALLDVAPPGPPRRPPRRARASSAARRRARSAGAAVRKNFTGASGNTTVPMSRPSITTPPAVAERALQRHQALAHHRDASTTRDAQLARVGAPDRRRHVAPVDDERACPPSRSSNDERRRPARPSAGVVVQRRCRARAPATPDDAVHRAACRRSRSRARCASARLARALPRAGRPVDRDDESAASGRLHARAQRARAARRSRGTRRRRTPGRRSRPPPSPASPATANAIAMRWSPRGSTRPPRERPPSGPAMHEAVGVLLDRDAEARRSCASAASAIALLHAQLRGVARSRVSPSAQRRGDARGSAARRSPPAPRRARCVVPRSAPCAHDERRRAARRASSRVALDASMSAPMRREDRERARCASGSGRRRASAQLGAGHEQRGDDEERRRRRIAGQRDRRRRAVAARPRARRAPPPRAERDAHVREHALGVVAARAAARRRASCRARAARRAGSPTSPARSRPAASTSTPCSAPPSTRTGAPAAARLDARTHGASGSATRSIGRRRSEPSPSSVHAPGTPGDAGPSPRRIVVPEFAQSIAASAARAQLEPAPVDAQRVAVVRRPSTPSAPHAVERRADVGAAARSPRTTVVPSASAPRSSARCAIDLSPGTVTSPRERTPRSSARGTRRHPRASVEPAPRRPRAASSAALERRAASPAAMSALEAVAARRGTRRAPRAARARSRARCRATARPGSPRCGWCRGSRCRRSRARGARRRARPPTAAHERVGDHVRQVRYARQDRVVRRGVHLLDARARRLPRARARAASAVGPRPRASASGCSAGRGTGRARAARRARLPRCRRSGARRTTGRRIGPARARAATTRLPSRCRRR